MLGGDSVFFLFGEGDEGMPVAFQVFQLDFGGVLVLFVGADEGGGLEFDGAVGVEGGIFEGGFFVVARLVVAEKDIDIVVE